MKKNLFFKTVLLSAVTSSLLLAQNNSVKLEEITVTANKIEENVQDIPQSITVITEDIIEEKRITKIEDIVKEIPNMDFSKNINSFVSFRGINSSEFAFNNPIVIYIDGIAYYDYSDYNPSLVNVKQIEVLRGPQGTLYGKNAIGGVINIITKEPENELQGNIGLEYGNYNNRKLSFNISKALIEDKFFAGINGLIQNDDGWIINNYQGKDDKANEKTNKRLSTFFKFNASDNLSGKLTLSHDNYEENFMTAMPVDPSIKLDKLKRDDIKDANFDVPQLRKKITNSQSLKLDYDLNDMKIQSITSHKDFYMNVNDDSDHTADKNNLGYTNKMLVDVETWSQEFRFSGENDYFRWVSGIYLDDEKRDQGPYGYSNYMFGTMNLESILNSETKATFAQVMIPFAKDFELTLGGRYQKVTKDIDLNFYGSFDGGPSYNTYKDEKSWTSFLPKIALSYKINDNLNTYVSIAKGHIPGGFNFFSFNKESNSAFNPQESINYELGLKYLGEDFVLNTAIFRMDMKDMHVYKKLTGNIAIVDNASEAHSQGIEIDGKYFLFDNLELSASLGLIKAEYDDYKVNNVDYSNQKIKNTPRFTSNLGIAYVSNRGWYGRADIQGRGKTSYERNNKMEDTKGGFTANAKVGYKLNDLDIYAYITNISNEEFISFYNHESSVGFNEPRRFGIGLKYNF